MARWWWSLAAAACLTGLAASFVPLGRASGPAPSQAARPADPTADARCGPAALVPVPDGRPITVTLPPAAAITVGAIPPG
ncbi:hypothetical protein AB0M20_45645, partial [Actinoplanes sp. NPDC051633]|uniref:hypothetical protein n=1 Tax=Actinoplanes sp. NPDC051633 TaxID=3155670 RepID=UPI00344968FD